MTSKQFPCFIQINYSHLSSAGVLKYSHLESLNFALASLLGMKNLHGFRQTPFCLTLILVNEASFIVMVVTPSYLKLQTLTALTLCAQTPQSQLQKM